jgi:hypothetical protein
VHREEILRETRVSGRRQLSPHRFELEEVHKGARNREDVGTIRPRDWKVELCVGRHVVRTMAAKAEEAAKPPRLLGK